MDLGRRAGNSRDSRDAGDGADAVVRCCLIEASYGIS